MANQTKQNLNDKVVAASQNIQSAYQHLQQVMDEYSKQGVSCEELAGASINLSKSLVGIRAFQSRVINAH